MTKQEFVEKVAILIQKTAPKYGVLVNSPTIAQAILESAYGTSELAVNANNYSGLKYSKDVSTKPAYIKNATEQRPDGSYYVVSSTQWCSFNSLEEWSEGHFKFLFCRKGVTRYENLKGITDPRQYLETIKADGYATSLKYVDNLMKVINDWDLTKYDKTIEDKKMEYTNSSLVNYIKLSPNYTNGRDKIDTITIHCMAGNLSVESCANVFQNPSRQASSNYGIGSDGRIGLYVEEKNRSWCSSNKANDMRAVTIEVANDGGAPDWHVSDKAMNSLIKLCADICRRNNIKELKWLGDKNLIGQIDKQNMTVHRWFAAKACPGDYLYNKHGYIANEVNKLLGKTPNPEPAPIEPVPQPQPAPASVPYKVRITTNALNIRKGPGTNYAVTGCIKDKGVYTIVEEQNGFGKLKSGAGWICLKYTQKI